MFCTLLLDPTTKKKQPKKKVNNPTVNTKKEMINTQTQIEHVNLFFLFTRIDHFNHTTTHTHAHTKACLHQQLVHNIALSLIILQVISILLINFFYCLLYSFFFFFFYFYWKIFYREC